ncbi:MAG TPA: polyprenyl synthetase family protein [Trueperaceae bacterium]|nr:polyprenyl synthetase family protein [Trueperaceae bacterium]
MFELIQEDLTSFEERLKGELRSSVAFIEAIGDDLVGAGGKRLRPSLSFLAGRLLRADAERSMLVALAVELLHSASLLHDDLIDDAQTRRGSQAAFRRYGNVVSVMSGDFMLARVLDLLAETGSAAFTRLMSRTAAAICEGEVLQFQTATLEDYSFDAYDAVIEGKTAILLASALEGVAILADAGEDARRAVRAYGMRYGRAFQMQDDYLDLLGDAERLGKPVGGDLREGKATYPVLLLLLEHGVDEVRTILRRHASREGDVARVVELVEEHGADERTRVRIREEAERAVEALAGFPGSPAREALTDLAEREIARAR